MLNEKLQKKLNIYPLEERWNIFIEYIVALTSVIPISFTSRKKTPCDNKEKSCTKYNEIKKVKYDLTKQTIILFKHNDINY